ncbi:MAG: DUF2537 domain-containing protein [Anaerolineae bacterium]|nr:DUF2537 domain-containing protein [Anaerolineae bacterium]
MGVGDGVKVGRSVLVAVGVKVACGVNVGVSVGAMPSTQAGRTPYCWRWSQSSGST